ncbi:DUF1015 domain-containing protein [Flavobacteriales bacterium]|nr:DUF1015 domain-containing protein [Flavobacteriales bacterium]MDC3103901.1 DUF1015 domain-containing protein [Flavobacteriales bacterium]
MAKIVPFRAIRPSRDKVSLVASRPFLGYSKEILVEKLENNPYTFLHIINADYSAGYEINSYDEKFKLVKDKFNSFIEEGIFQKDNSDSFYIYQKNNEDGNSFIGIIGAAYVIDYQNGNIKIHEQTIQKREELFKTYLQTTGFNAEPVLLTYPNHKCIDEIIQRYRQTRAEYEFTTTNKSQHKLWLVNDENDIQLIERSFSKIENLYIADGHHRFASSSLLAKESNNSNTKYCMSYLIAEDQLKIISFNRLIKNLNGLSDEDFLTQIKVKYDVKEVQKALVPNQKDEITLYISEKWYSLIAKEEYVNRTHCVEKLDQAILSNNILAPILAITDPRNDKRLAFIDGTHSLKEIKHKVDSEEFKAAFVLKPISVNQIKEVADNGQTMPPKSTYIQPKLRSGMLIYDFEN